MIIAVIAIAGFIVGCLLVRFIIRKIGKRTFRKLAEALTGQTNTAIQELESMSLPTHMVTDNDIEDFKTSHQSLLESIERIEFHKYFNNDIFEEKGLAHFKSMFANIHASKEENNKVYNAIGELRECAPSIMNDYRSLVHPAHYFTYTELEDFIKSYNRIKEKVDLVFPRYAQFVTDSDSKELPNSFNE